MKPRRSVKLALCLTILLGACSVDEAMPGPSCTGNTSGILIAQSVPSASLVPCLSPLPIGWEVSSVSINQNGAKIILDSDRAGDEAAVLRFMSECPLAVANPIQRDHNDAQRYGQILRLEPSYRAERYYVFEGGCVKWNFDFDGSVPPTLASEIEQTLILLRRIDVNDSVRESFIDRDL